MVKPFTLYKCAKELGEELSRLQGTLEGEAIIIRTNDADGPLGMTAHEFRSLQSTLNTFFANDPTR